MPNLFRHPICILLVLFPPYTDKIVSALISTHFPKFESTGNTLVKEQNGSLKYLTNW